MIPVFRATVTKCRLDIHDPAKYAVYLAGLEGQQVELTVKRPEKKRSNAENRYYHGVMIPILADFFGYTPEETHEAVKLQFLVDRTKDFPTIRSTKQLSTVEFEKLMTDIRQWAATEYGIYIPLPNEIDY